MSAEFLGNVIFKGKLECLTGLHIGGSKEKFEIGGVDSPVIRDPNTQYPYIPGSSLKGKMRSLLAFSLGKADQDPPKRGKFDPNCPLQRIFGVPAEINSNMPEIKGIGPSRLIVRDSHPDDATVALWKSMDSELMFTEYKPENTIDRITSAANPRFLERVVKGSVFNVEFIFGVYKIDKLTKSDAEYIINFVESLKLLEHSTLGGSGSRGYGQVAFKFAEPIVLKADDYRIGSDKFKDALKPHDDLRIENVFNKRLSDFTEDYIKGNIINKFSV